MSLTLIPEQNSRLVFVPLEKEIAKIWCHYSQEQVSEHFLFRTATGELEGKCGLQPVKCPAPWLQLDVAQLTWDSRESALNCGIWPGRSLPCDWERRGWNRWKERQVGSDRLNGHLERSLNNEPWTPGTVSRNLPKAHTWLAPFNFYNKFEDARKLEWMGKS